MRALTSLVEALRERRVVVLAGAGCSTESGIPDYRGVGAPRRRAPIRYGEFMGSSEARVRYWARSVIGWPRFSASRPNAAHRALARLEEGGVVMGVITQNVDGLHQAAGSRRVVELHGSLAGVVCMACGRAASRDAVQLRIETLNRKWLGGLTQRGGLRSAPDGDAELPDRALNGFSVPDCEACGGILKPDVVFFGENVPPDRVAEAWRLFDEAEVLLVVGSSLSVYSGRRFVYGARKVGVPVAIVNIGSTRCDDMAAVKVEERLGEVLPRLAEAILTPRTRVAS